MIKKYKWLVIFTFWIVTKSTSAQWVTVAQFPIQTYFLKVKFLDTQRGYLLEGKSLLYTTNAGVSWSSTNLVLGSDVSINADFPNDTTIIVAYRSMVGNSYTKFGLAISTDAGQNWVKKEYPNIAPGFGSINPLFFVDKDYGYVGALYNAYRTYNNSTDSFSVVYSSNPSVSWQDTAYRVENFHFLNIAKAFIVGDKFKTNLIIPSNVPVAYMAVTHDGANTWNDVHIPSHFRKGKLLTMDFVNDSIGYTAGTSGIFLATTDGGTTWQDRSLPDSIIRIQDMEFVNEQTGYICGRRTGSNTPFRSFIYKTTNGGISWHPQLELSQSMYGFNSLSFPSLNTGYAVGYVDWVPNPFQTPPQNRVFRTTNGGGTLTNLKEYAQSAEHIFSVYPNPITSESVIQYKLNEAGNIQLSIMDMLGKEVAVLAQAYQNAGNYELTWQPPSGLQGMYLLVLQTAQGKQTKKIVVQ